MLCVILFCVYGSMDFSDVLANLERNEMGLFVVAMLFCFVLERV